MSDSEISSDENAIFDLKYSSDSEHRNGSGNDDNNNNSNHNIKKKIHIPKQRIILKKIMKK